jgi:hypothetical protein
MNEPLESAVSLKKVSSESVSWICVVTCSPGAHPAPLIVTGEPGAYALLSLRMVGYANISVSVSGFPDASTPPLISTCPTAGTAKKLAANSSRAMLIGSLATKVRVTGS